MGIWPAGARRASPTSGSVCAGSPISRAISATAGRPGSSNSGRMRVPLTRRTPSNRDTACMNSRREPGGFGGGRRDGGAHIEIGRQHHIQPVRDRIAKARHHHRERHRQAERCHDAADGNRRALAHAARALHREQRQQAAAQRRRQPVVHQRDGPGQGRDAAHQQQADRDVRAERNAHHRRHQGQRDTGRHQQQADGAPPRAKRSCAQPLEGLRQRQLLRPRAPATSRRPRRPPCPAPRRPTPPTRSIAVAARLR